eukprot:3590874-Lingulodinium_polyedra.AAC.1
MSTWELLVHLQREGWSHKYWRAKDEKPPPLELGSAEPQLHIYLLSGNATINVNYLWALADRHWVHERGQDHIAHLESDNYYKCLREYGKAVPALSIEWNPDDGGVAAEDAGAGALVAFCPDGTEEGDGDGGDGE